MNRNENVITRNKMDNHLTLMFWRNVTGMSIKQLVQLLSEHRHHNNVIRLLTTSFNQPHSSMLMVGLACRWRKSSSIPKTDNRQTKLILNWKFRGCKTAVKGSISHKDETEASIYLHRSEKPLYFWPKIYLHSARWALKLAIHGYRSSN